MNRVLFSIVSLTFAATGFTQEKQPRQQQPSEQQLANWLKRFPEADTDKDGKLTVTEALAYRKKLQAGKGKGNRRGVRREFQVDPGWEAERFPEHAACYKSPEKIRAIYAETLEGNQEAVISFEKPDNGALRIVGTGHSFMAPGYRTLPKICEAAGFTQPLHTHTGGGMTGSARYKWEQENGIFQFDGEPVPRLLASVANAEWDAMMWGPYYKDRPAFYSCWIDFCLKYNPGMKFYLSDAWPQLSQLDELPETEEVFTEDLFDKIGKEKREIYIDLVGALREDYPDKVFILPTSDAMVLAGKRYLRGELPEVEGISRFVGKKERSLWKDQLGHLGPGFDRLEGYVFYATLYGKSPERIEGDVRFGNNPDADFPGPELDAIFRRIAWEAVTNHPLTGVTDTDGDGINDAAAE